MQGSEAVGVGVVAVGEPHRCRACAAETNLRQGSPFLPAGLPWTCPAVRLYAVSHVPVSRALLHSWGVEQGRQLTASDGAVGPCAVNPQRCTARTIDHVHVVQYSTVYPPAHTRLVEHRGACMFMHYNAVHRMHSRVGEHGSSSAPASDRPRPGSRATARRRCQASWMAQRPFATRGRHCR